MPASAAFIQNALSLIEEGRRAEAESLLAGADAGAALEAGALLLDLGKPELALSVLDKALVAEPRHLEAWIERGAALELLDRWDDALAAYEKAIEIAPQSPEALFAAGVVLGRTRVYEDALLCFDAVLALAPDYPYAEYNRGRMFLMMEREAEALVCFDKALLVHPNDMNVWHSRAVALEGLGRYDEAIAAYDKAAEAGRGSNAGWALPLFHKCLILLKRRDYAQGFALYPYRFSYVKKFPGQAPIDNIPTWRGEATSAPVRIWAEQGLGDQIIFSRLAPLALARAPNLVWECDPRMTALLERAYPLMRVRSLGDPVRDAAAQISACELPMLIGMQSPRDLPLPPLWTPRADPAAKLAERYRAMARERKIVGLAWRSNVPAGKHKSAPLLHWAALLKRDYFFVSLQYGDVGAELAEAQAALDCTIYEDKDVDQVADIEMFFAQVAAMDHVVTISNTTAHVAGALGKPTHVLVSPSRGLHWYWELEGDRCAWHPSLRIVRRSGDEDWNEQVARAADAVEEALR